MFNVSLLNHYYFWVSCKFVFALATPKLPTDTSTDIHTQDEKEKKKVGTVTKSIHSNQWIETNVEYKMSILVFSTT